MAASLNTNGVLYGDSTQQNTAFLGQNYQAFGSSGTFTVPTGITKIMVQVWAGGGGGRGVNSPGQVGSGGGVCGFGAAIITGLTPGGSITVTVGAGGAGGNGANGSTGGTSSFGTYVSCTGGVGGSAVSGVPRALPGAATFSGVAQILAKTNYVLNQPSTTLYSLASPQPSVSWGGGQDGTQGFYDACGSAYPGGGGGGGYGGGGGGGTNSSQNGTGLGGPAYGGGVSGASAPSITRVGGNGGGNGIASNGGAGATGSTYGGGGGGGGGFVLVTW